MVIKSYGAKRAYIKSCTYFLLKSLSHFGVTFTLNYIYAIGRLSACNFQNLRPLEGAIAISVTQNSIIGHTGKSLGAFTQDKFLH